jgi:hypothetical protein
MVLWMVVVKQFVGLIKLQGNALPEPIPIEDPEGKIQMC